MSIYVEDLIRQAQENAAMEEQKIRSQVTEEVNAFVINWLKELKETGNTEVRKRITLEEGETIFASVEIAKEILYGMGFRMRSIPEETKGILWWKRVTRPASLVISPARKQQ